jgi:hypothetical protein
LRQESNEGGLHAGSITGRLANQQGFSPDCHFGSEQISQLGTEGVCQTNLRRMEWSSTLAIEAQ